MHILIRFDDICPTMDYIQWGRAMDVLEKYNIKPLIGVIPDCQDPDLMIAPPHSDFWEYRKELQNRGFAIAMHGYIHVYDTKVRGEVNHSYHSEFAGHPYEVQYEKIKKGKEILRNHGVESDIFFATAHSYDDNTIRALSANGFKYMSDGLGMKAVNRHGVKCLPCHFCGSKLPLKPSFMTYVFHAHEWATVKNAAEYDLLKRICETRNKEIVSFEEYTSQPIGAIYLQYMIGRIIVSYNRYIWPQILKLYYISKS